MRQVMRTPLMTKRVSRDRLPARVRELENELSSCFQALQKQIPRSYFKGIVENASDAIYIHDLEGNFTDVNEMACRILGYSRQQLLALSAFDVDTELDPRMGKALWKKMDGDEVFSFRGRSQRKDGSVFPVDVRVKPLEIEGQKHIIAIVRDMSEVLQREESLRLSEERYRAVVECQTELICRWKPGGILTFVNGAYCRYFDKTEDELLGTSFYKFIPDSDLAGVKKYFANFSKENSFARHEHRGVDGKGNVRWLQWTNRAIFDDSGNLVEFQDVGRDITDDKENQARIKEMQGKLIEADKISALGRLVAGVAHEINNSINFMSAALPSLARNFKEIKEMAGPPPDGTEELSLSVAELYADTELLLANINEGSRRAKKIVNDLCSFADPRRDELLCVDLHPVIDSTLSLIYSQYHDRITVNKEYAAEKSRIYCYPNQMAQLFMNILLNAFQAIEGTGLITIQTANIEHSFSLTIQDSGPGIDKSIEKKIFEPFFTTKPMGTGTGLGLSISYGIVKNINGEIKCSSESGAGTSFHILLPLDARVYDKKQ